MKTELKDKIAGKIASTLNAIQCGWAAWMSKQVNRHPIRVQKMMLWAWSAGSGLLCVLLIAQGFSKNEKQLKSRPERLTTPSLLPQRNNDLSALIRFTDSIKKHAPDQWDSLRKYRPGLADTILRLRE